MKEDTPRFEAQEGYVYLANYCMIAPSEDELFDPHNGIAGSGS